MKLSDFDYNLPKELIADWPLEERDTAKLLVVNRSKAKIEHRIFRDLKEYLSNGDLLVLNDTKVMPCRLVGKRKTGGRVELLLLKEKPGMVFDTLLKPGRVKLNEEIIFNNGAMRAELISRNEVKFKANSTEEIYGHGTMPLPPYIKRQAELSDNTHYQTVYAKNPGAVASPTAGLHFTDKLLKDINNSGVNSAYVTLHVGFATFNSVKVDDITEHRMEYEDFKVDPGTVKLIEETRKNKKKIFAVGTTSCRVLETLAKGIKEGKTDLFIYPGYQFQLVDCLITNFHLPRTTLFMLVCAFAGEQLAKKAYQEAIENKYRFYSYGDAMLII